MVREIRAHIREATREPGSSLNSVLYGLGTPEQLAQQCYQIGFAPSARRRSPLLMILSLLRQVTRGLSGLVILLAGVIGYLTGGVLLLTAFLKLLMPNQVGTWIWHGHLIASGLLLSAPRAQAQEVMGWHYIPVMVALSGLILAMTHQTIRITLSGCGRLLNRPTPGSGKPVLL